MNTKFKWTLLAGVGVGTLIAAAAWLSTSTGPAQENSLGQRANAAIDNMQALGLRLLDLPLFILLAAAGILTGAATVFVDRAAKRRPRMARIALAAGIVSVLLALAVMADRHIARLQDQLNVLRGQLTAERMTNGPKLPADSIAAPAALAKAAPITAPAAPSPNAAAKPASPARDTPLVDLERVKNNLAVNFTGANVRPMVLDQATDAYEIKIASPRVVAYVSVTNLAAPGVQVQFGGSLNFKSYTSDFARNNNCVVAINGEAGQSPMANSGFGPWFGNMVSAGKSLIKENPTNLRPFLSFDNHSHAAFTAQFHRDRTVASDAFNVVWGRIDAVVDGTVQTANERDRQPRTAMGIDKDGNTLVMLVVDGRQPNYSIGLTRAEVGQLLKAFGTHNGMLCDEGGSSCMYIKNFNAIVNSPSDGEERITYTHFGIALREPVPAP